MSQVFLLVLLPAIEEPFLVSPACVPVAGLGSSQAPDLYVVIPSVMSCIDQALVLTKVPIHARSEGLVGALSSLYGNSCIGHFGSNLDEAQVYEAQHLCYLSQKPIKSITVPLFMAGDRAPKVITSTVA